MRIFLIKSKGAIILQNMYFDKAICFSNNTKIHTGLLFFRKKDAKAYLQTMIYKELYEVIGATIDVPKSNFK